MNVNNPQPEGNRADRILISAALLVMLISMGLFYFDSWMWGSRRSRADKIGYLTSRSGDVRLKYEGELKWQKANRGQDLVYNDSVYVGEGSHADLGLGESKLTVTENTLVILRREQNVNFLNLNYGMLFGKLAKNERIVIDSGGSKIELSAKQNADLVIKKVGKKTQLNVVKGVAEVMVAGKLTKLDSRSELFIGDEVELKRNQLSIVKPLREQIFSAREPLEISFAWAYEKSSPIGSQEEFTLEFSEQPSFAKVLFKKVVKGQLQTKIFVRETTRLYFRVAGPKNEFSNTQRLVFNRIEAPELLTPLQAERVEALDKEKALVQFQVKKNQYTSVWLQVAEDENFTRPIYNQNSTDSLFLKELPIGKYFARVRADFGEQILSDWSKQREFSVIPPIEELRLSERSPPTRIIIPNLRYPKDLYHADYDIVRQFLRNRGAMEQFFREPAADELEVKLNNGEIHKSSGRAWPESLLQPSLFNYQYKIKKADYRDSKWSESKRLEIVMEPPKPLGSPQFDDPSEDGKRKAAWAFTPLLFARTYDVEISRDPSFRKPKEINISQANVEVKLIDGEIYYWRARARDQSGHLISDFSKAYSLGPMPKSIPQFLAKRDPQTVEEPPETLRARIERTDHTFERNGWWTWVGAGHNYVNYRQSVPDRGSLTFSKLRGPSQFFEGGFTSRSGMGGVVSFKRTPGAVEIENASIDRSNYDWTTTSIEAMLRRRSSIMLLNRPVIYGLRAGIQRHQIPYVFVDSNDELKLKDNQMDTASLGLMADWSRRRWNYHWLMRYQFPLSAKADGATRYDISPTFAFDGSIGTSYSLSQQMRLGLFWYGQWHQFNFVFDDGLIANEGSQSLFYSNIDFRFGFEF